MKSLMSRIAIAVVIASFVIGAAFAKTKTETFTLPTSIKFNGTVINKGVYRVKFDDQSNELSILNERGKVIARATATLEKREAKARQFMLKSVGSGNDTELIGVTFGGSETDLVVGSAAARRQ